MENRFGFKELVISTLLVLVIIVVLLAMKQFDRQYQVISRIKEQQDEQIKVQAEMNRNLARIAERGIAAGPVGAQTAPSTAGGDDAASPSADSFDRMRAARANPDFAEGDWCVDAFGANVAKITPLIAVDVYGNVIAGTVLESLAVRDPNTFKFLPHLATSWKVVDTSDQWQAYLDKRLKTPLTEKDVTQEPAYLLMKSGGEDEAKLKAYVADRLKEGRTEASISDEPECPVATTITFQIRKGVTFSDGQPLTAHDVEFTYRFTMNEKIDAPRDREGLRDIVRDVKATGDYEVVFTFKKPYFESFGVAAGFSVMPRHFYGKFSPEEFNKAPGLLLGSGAYRMESPTDWAPGKQLTLVRNERYWGVRPAFERLIYLEVPSESTRETKFKNREIDMFSAQPEQYIKLVKDPEILKRTQHFEYERVTGGYGFVAWNERRNNKPTIFADKRVRQAMTMMIDRERLFKEILLGYGIPVTGPFNRLNQQSDPSIKPWPFDIDAAKAKLKEAGYFDRDGDGVIDGPDGKPFKFKMLFPSQTGFWDRVILMLKDNVAKAGVVLELEPLEWSVFSERVKNRDYDALCMAWAGGIESDIRQMFHSSQIENQADNFVSYSNPDLDKLIDQARRTVDEEKRMPLWRACHRILHEDQPYTFLYSRISLGFYDGRIKNIERTKVGLNDRDEWYVPKGQQLRAKQ